MGMFEINEEYRLAYNELKKAYDNSFLLKEKVILPRMDTYKAIDLVYCYLHLGEIYREEDMRRYFEGTTGVNRWRQPRHFGTQFGWNHYCCGEELPSGYILKNGEFCIWDIKHCKKGYNPNRRSQDPISNEEFEELKKSYGYKCATCGDLEGSPHHLYRDKIVKLQKGHINPNKALVISNCIPQCQCCNQGSENHWIYNKAGEIYAPNTVEAVLRNDDIEFRRKLLKALLV